MWILSQNKDILVNIDKVIGFNTNEKELNIIANYGEDESAYYVLGDYKNVARLQEVFKQLTDAVIHPTDYGNKFKMPEE